MNEVMGRAVVAIVDNMRRNGVSTDSAMARLPVSETALRSPTCRVDWTAFAEFLNEMEISAGGQEAFEQVWTTMQPGLFVEFSSLFRAVLSVRDLFRVSFALMPGIYFGLRLSDIDTPDGRLLVTIDIPDTPYPEPFFHACSGGMRSVPQILGLPCVDVATEISGCRGVFTISLAESRTFVARLRRASVAILVRAAIAEVERSWFETRRRLEESEATNARLVELTRKLEKEAHERQRAESVLRAALDVFDASLFVVATDGSLSPLDDGARAALEHYGEPLRARIREVADGAADPFLHRIDSEGESNGPRLVVRREAGRAFADRLERISSEWLLTPRQVEVVALLVRGMTNKEIAANLGCAMHTAELHVTELLKRSGVANERAWSRPSGAQSRPSSRGEQPPEP